MPEHCGRSPNEALLSGYLDESLTQVDDQRVRPHAALRGIVEGEVSESTKLMAESREQALDRMVEEARGIGANAIVSARFQTSMVLQGGSPEQLAFGTAVVVEDGC